jgi:hypothetical protein
VLQPQEELEFHKVKGRVDGLRVWSAREDGEAVVVVYCKPTAMDGGKLTFTWDHTRDGLLVLYPQDVTRDGVPR